MKGLMLWVACMLGFALHMHAQTAEWPTNPSYRVGMHLTQLLSNQLHLEIERQAQASKYSVLGQVFGGYLEPLFTQNGSAAGGSYNRATHWGLGMALRTYDKAAGSRVFVHMGGFYKETYVWYMQKQWQTQLQDGLPVYRYVDSEVMDRYAGFGGEFLAGAQGFAGRVVIEAACGVVIRNMRTAGTFHGRNFSGFDGLGLHMGHFTPVFVGKVGYIL